VYGQALLEGAPLIPAGLLSGHTAPVVMPPRPGPSLVAEPWVDTDDVTLEQRGGAVVAARAGRVDWLEFTVGLLGGAVRREGARGARVGEGCSTSACPPAFLLLAWTGSRARTPHASSLPPLRPPPPQADMHAMAPSIVAHRPDGGRHYVTPPPPSLLAPGLVEAVQWAAVEMAEHLALRWGPGTGGRAGDPMPSSSPPPTLRRLHPTHPTPARPADTPAHPTLALPTHPPYRGLCQVDGFVHAETGDIIVLDVRPYPKLVDGHPLLQQVRAAPHSALRRPPRPRHHHPTSARKTTPLLTPRPCPPIPWPCSPPASHPPTGAP
jgi:hypothetical protein